MQPESTTILFTDIEGSTRLWEQQPEVMSRALARHDALARLAVERNNGVVVKMIGDGMYAAFSDPVDGLNATLALQQALADPAATEGVPLRVRCGLHLGQVERRDNDFFGPPVNRSARIMGAAHGGQVLVSQAVADQVGQRLPPEVALRDLGGIRLKDLASPERVFQIVHPKLRDIFPALRSLEATPNNLPQQLTAFFGRERELRELTELLQSSRLLTLLGMGGLGKTRLSLQIAADALDAFPDGVWFVDLAPIRDGALVPSAVAQVLAVQEEAGRPLIQTLCAHLKSRQLLIILDNCEHLVVVCADLVKTLLQAAPNSRILATSREALRVPGEQTYAILPLPVPERTADIGALAKFDAVQLFADRARLHKTGFALTARDAPAVAELCARLEGIPLALELAAARMRALSLSEINIRLRDRFKLLTGGGRVLLERQQTLRALVAWSYDLLQPNEQLLFDRLCVFAGGFDLAASEEVCGADPLAPEDVIDLLTSLVDKSLVMAEERPDGMRYRTLETIRDYAREKLNGRGEAATGAARHCDYFLVMAKAGRAGIHGPDQAEWTRRLETELDNMRAAATLALEGQVDPILAVKFQVALMSFWILRGYVAEGRKSVAAALELPAVQASDVAHAHALQVGATLAASQSDHVAAARMLESCLTLRRSIGNPVEIAATLSTLSVVRLNAGDAIRARECEEEALGIFREVKDRIGEAIGLLHLGQTWLYVQDEDRASDNFNQSIAIAREIEHCEIESECQRMLGEIALENGDIAGARARFTRSLEVCRGAGDKRDEATSLWWMGKADVAAGEAEVARWRLQTALGEFHAFGMSAELLDCLEDLAALARHEGSAEDAALLYAAAAARRERLALKRQPRSEQRWRDAIAGMRQALGNAFETTWAAGTTLTLEQAVQRAKGGPAGGGESTSAVPAMVA